MSKHLFLLATWSLILGCQTSNVSIDYDTQANFAEYKYYNWQDTISENQNKTETQEDPLIIERVKKAISKQLHNSNIVPASPSHPATVLLHYHVKSTARTAPPKTRGSVGLGRTGANTGIGLAIRFPLSKESVKKDVSIFIDLVDAKDGQLKWRGSKNLVFANETPEHINTIIEAGVAEIFSHYPPTKQIQQ